MGSRPRCTGSMHAVKVLLLAVFCLSLTGCLAISPQSARKNCYGYQGYCQERDGPRQYIRAPDAYPGNYCLQNPTEC
jgi:hypothetical protein